MTAHERELEPLAERPGVYVVPSRSRRFFPAELGPLTLRDGLIVWDISGEPDEPIRSVYPVDHPAGIALLLTDRNVYIADAAELAAQGCGPAAAPGADAFLEFARSLVDRNRPLIHIDTQGNAHLSLHTLNALIVLAYEAGERGRR
jgi:hypothetical protein